MPRRAGTDGLKLCTSTSACFTSRFSASSPAGFLRSSTMPSLLRFVPRKARDSPSSVEGYCRSVSPVGGSILITFAPRSASSEQPYGPAIYALRSNTLIPVKGPRTASLPNPVLALPCSGIVPDSLPWREHPQPLGQFHDALSP